MKSSCAHFISFAAACFYLQAASLPSADGFSFVQRPCAALVVGHSSNTALCVHQKTQSRQLARGSLSMDSEDPWNRHRSIFHKYQVQVADNKSVPIPKESITTQRRPAVHQDISPIDEELARHGMPWKSSIDPTYPHDELFYMPFWEWQLDFMKEQMTNLRVVPTVSAETGHDLSYRESDCGQVRMITLCFASDEYRKIRMTVYDAGNQTQVFTSLWYPRECYNLPVLGVDLLQFNQQRHLCVVDMQPIHSKENSDHNNKHQQHEPYEHLLQPIRNQYPSLQGQMTKRFYDETQFFSQQMLLTRCEELNNSNEKQQPPSKEQHPVFRDLMPAYQQYVQAHLDLVRSTTPKAAVSHVVQQAQAAYDAYSAERDPAHAMFVKRFGQEFADDFVYNILFEYSRST